MTVNQVVPRTDAVRPEKISGWAAFFIAEGVEKDANSEQLHIMQKKEEKIMSTIYRERTLNQISEADVDSHLHVAGWV